MKEPLMNRLCDWLVEEIEDCLNRHRESVKDREALLEQRLEDVEQDRRNSENDQFTNDLREYYARCVERDRRAVEHERVSLEQDKKAIDELLEILVKSKKLKECCESFWAERKKQWQESSQFWQQLKEEQP